MNEPVPMDDPGTGDNPGTGIDGDHPGTGIDPVSTIRHETGVERRDPRRCTAHNRAGAPCGKFAMRGQTVYGGGSPQAKAKGEEMIELAEMRLRGLAPVAVAQLEALVTSASSEGYAWLPRGTWWTGVSGEPPNAFRSRRPSR